MGEITQPSQRCKDNIKRIVNIYKVLQEQKTIAEGMVETIKSSASEEIQKAYNAGVIEGRKNTSDTSGGRTNEDFKLVYKN